MGTVQRLALSQDLTIYTALDSKQALLDVLNTSDALELDLSQVGEIDTAGVQVLMLAKREAHTKGKEFKIVAHSSVVRQTLDFCNLASYFGDPVVISANEQV